jgi:hypothetical protein
VVVVVVGIVVVVVVVLVVVVLVVVVLVVVVLVVVVVVVGGGVRAATVTTHANVLEAEPVFTTTRTVQCLTTKLPFGRTRPPCWKSAPPQLYVPLNVTPVPAESVHRLPLDTSRRLTTKVPPVLGKCSDVMVAVST